MASLLTHAALPLLVGRAIQLPAGVPRRRLALAAVACACIPDRDVIAFAFDIQKTEPEGDHYVHVGLQPVPFHWQAALLLGPEQEILGGRWTGDPPDGPDKATFSSGPPLLDGGMLQIQPKLEWAFIDALATASAAQGPGAATLVLDGGTP